jgi:hypothetical protein
MHLIFSHSASSLVLSSPHLLSFSLLTTCFNIFRYVSLPPGLSPKIQPRSISNLETQLQCGTGTCNGHHIALTLKLHTRWDTRNILRHREELQDRSQFCILFSLQYFDVNNFCSMNIVSVSASRICAKICY